MRKRLAFLLSMLLVISLFSVPVDASTAQVKEWEKSLNSAISNRNWYGAGQISTKIAEYYEGQKQFEKAVKYYEEAGKNYTKSGSPSWEVASTVRAEQVRTEVSLYVERPLPLNRQLEKFEPEGGTYLGFYLAGKRENANPDVVKDVYGRNHAMYLTYAHWRKKYPNTNSYFPLEFAEKAKRNGAAIQVAWEPSFGLDDVKDDEYVRQFAREAKQTNMPVFIRFAGEMNGEWVPWHDKPEKYREKFRLIYKIMKEEAPNVAMVWSPNFLPRHNIAPFYPGDDYVDWIGFSLYTIPFSHGREVPGGNPIDYLKPLYEEYSHKPIMISEGAVSHVSYEQNKDYSDWAASQIGNMYGFMPKMFPQLKAITYFNLDKMTTNYDNQNNNYDLADSKIVDDSYQRMIQHPYFLDHLNLTDPNPNNVRSEYVPIDQLKEVAGIHNAFVYVKLPLGKQPYYVAVYQGKTKLGESYAQPWEMKIDFKKVDPKQPLTLIAFDKSFKRLATKNIKPSFKLVDKIGKFSDVKATHWAFSAIEKAESDGIVKGYPGGEFKPEHPVSSVEFVAMLERSFSKKDAEQKPYPQGFIDYMKKMNYPHWDKGSKGLTRTEAAEIISGMQGMNLSGDDAIKYLLNNKLAKGKVPGKTSVENYNGKDVFTRAQSVTFIEHLQNAGIRSIIERPKSPTDPASIRDEYSKMFE